MTYGFRYGLLVLACGVLLAGIARAEENNSAVTDGPSRGELFEARMRADMGPAYNPLSAAAIPAFVLPKDVKGDLRFGVDVSHYNDENCVCKPGEICSECKVDWSKAQQQKISFVYVKASQGTQYRDPTFAYHWRALAEKKIARGAYHFMSADEDPVAQADNFLDKLDESGKLLAVDLPPCLDLEADLRKDSSKRWIVTDTGEIRDFWLGQQPDAIVQKVLQWLKRVEEKTGRIPIIYTSRGWWNDRIKDEKKIALFSRYPIWIANYTDTGSPINGKPKVPNDQVWTLWQFTETGRTGTDTLPGKVDINVFNGELGSFERTLGVAIPEQKVAQANPSPPSDAAKPSEPAAEAKPSEPKDTGKSLIERRMLGWRHGQKRSETKRLNPLLVDWDKLPESDRNQRCRETADLPKMLAGAGYVLRRVNLIRAYGDWLAKAGESIDQAAAHQSPANEQPRHNVVIAEIDRPEGFAIAERALELPRTSLWLASREDPMALARAFSGDRAKGFKILLEKADGWTRYDHLVAGSVAGSDTAKKPSDGAANDSAVAVMPMPLRSVT